MILQECLQPHTRLKTTIWMSEPESILFSLNKKKPLTTSLSFMIKNISVYSNIIIQGFWFFWLWTHRTVFNLLATDIGFYNNHSNKLSRLWRIAIWILSTSLPRFS